MKLTKEEFENSLNGSALFDADRVRDRNLYDRLKNEFISLLLEYCVEYIFPNRPLENYGMAFMETAVDFISCYKKEKGKFLALFIPLLRRNVKIERAKEIEKDIKQGIEVGEKTSILICKIIKYANSKKIDLNNVEAQKKIAAEFNITAEKVAELLRINSETVVVGSTVKNEDGDEVELFDLMPSKELSAEQKVEDISRLNDLIGRIERGYNSLQNRPKQRRLLSMKLTANYLEEFGGERRLIELIEECSFYSKEIGKIYTEKCRVPTAREIAKALGVSEQAVSNTFREFIKKIK